MEQSCTCGATAPPNARFCPMCGRPLSEESERPLVEESESPLVEEPERSHIREGIQHMVQAEEGPGGSEDRERIGFGNSQALRSAYPAAFLAAVLGNIPFLHLLCFIWYPGAGFLAVHNYRKKTGSYPDTAGGAKLGWMTGVFTFVISMVMLAVVMLFASDGADLAEALRQQIDQMPGQPDVKRQMRDLIRNPTVIAFTVVIYLGVSFLITVGLTALGGALGAKVLERD